MLILELSDDATRWRPLGAIPRVATPDVDALVAFDHGVWRVVEVDEDYPERLWPEAHRQLVDRLRAVGMRSRVLRVALRPAWFRTNSPDPVAQRRKDIAVLSVSHHTSWDVYPSEHYPVCAQCDEPLPCRHVHAERVAERHMTTLARYEVAGICPACAQPITDRQKSIMFTENLELPGGPPVTFHLRRACRLWAERYEQRWVDADPKRRRTRLTCPGHLTNHNDGTYDCTALNECRGPGASHPSYSTCRCPDCHARGRFGCHPAPDARRNT